MLNSVVHAFSVSFPHPIEELWAVVSDTNRLNELVENPKYDAYEVLRDDGVVDVYGRLRAAGFVVEWLEVPVNWIENPWFEQVRRFSNGPLLELTARFEFSTGRDTCHCHIRLVAQPKNILGRLIGKQAAAKFEKGTRKVLAEADKGPRAREPIKFDYTVRLPASARARAQQIVETIEATSYGHGLAQQLADYVLSAQEVDLWTLRPLALARIWGEAAAVVSVSPGEYRHAGVVGVHGADFVNAFEHAEQLVEDAQPHSLSVPGLPWGSMWSAEAYVDCFNRDNRYSVTPACC